MREEGKGVRRGPPQPHREPKLDSADRGALGGLRGLRHIQTDIGEASSWELADAKWELIQEVSTLRIAEHYPRSP